MIRPFDDNTLHSANLLVCIGGVATATSALTGFGALVGGALSIKEIIKRLPKPLDDLRNTIAAELNAGLDAIPGLSRDQRILVHDMIAIASPSPQDITQAGQNADAVLVQMEHLLKTESGEREYQLDDTLSRFRQVVRPVLHRLLEDPAYSAQLAPFRDRAFWEMRGDVAEIRDGVQDILEILRQGQDSSGIPLETLQEIAAKFGEHDLTDRAALTEFLGLKAEEYRTYRAQIDALDDRVAAIANLKGAAQDAAGRLDFDEVEALLSRVDEVETEIAAETKVTRARNALLRGDADLAFRCLSAAADGFASVSPVAPAEKRVEFEDLLYAHGLRYGGNGLALAARMNRDALDDLDQEEASLTWARAQNNLAIALQEQGTRTGGAEGAALLADAVTAYRAALEVYTRDAHPVDWAMTQNNLGVALQTQGTRTGGAEGAALLVEAVTAYRAALEVRTRDAHPVDWAMTQNNLGNALQDQGTRTGGAEGAALLAEAVTAYRAALEVRTHNAHPVRWAMTQNNLGIALEAQGTRTGGAAGAALLAQAVTAYRAALEVRTRDAHPVHWAMTQNNLGGALHHQGTRTGGPEGAALLAEAVTTYRAALEVRTRDAHPVDWAMTQENLAIAEEAIADHESTDDPRPHLEAALAHVEAALEVFDPEHMPYNFDKAAKFRDRLRDRLASR